MISKRHDFSLFTLPLAWLWILFMISVLACQLTSISLPPTPSIEAGSQITPTLKIEDTRQNSLTPVKNCEQYAGKILFTSNMNNTNRNKFEIYMMDPDGRNLVPVTQDTYFHSSPTWSPDHCQIVFTSNHENSSYEDLYMINTDRTGLTQLTNSPGSEKMAAWSPDGKRIAYISLISRETVSVDLFIMNADGSQQVNLTNSPEQERDPEWSPDGKRILFECSNPTGEYDKHGGICLIDPDGANFTRITPISENNYMFPTWSPDGMQIALVANLTGQLDIYTIKPDGGDLKQVTSFGVQWEPNFLNWSTDGKKILFEDSSGILGGIVREDISILYLDGLRVVNLTNSDAGDHYPDW
jgi:TolB protein